MTGMSVHAWVSKRHNQNKWDTGGFNPFNSLAYRLLLPIVFLCIAARYESGRIQFFVRELLPAPIFSLSGLSIDPAQLQTDAEKKKNQQAEVTHLQQRIFD